MFYLCVVYDEYAPSGAKVLVPVEEMGTHPNIEPTPGWVPMRRGDRQPHHGMWVGRVAAAQHGAKRRRLAF